MEALPARQEEDSSGLEAGSAKEPAASLPWTEVDGHEAPPLTLSPAHLPGLGKRAWGCCPEGGHLGTARGTKEGIHNCFESPRALGPLKSPLEVDDFKGTGRDKSLINTASQARPARDQGGAGSWHQHPGRAHCGRVTKEWVLLHTCVHARRSRVHAYTHGSVFWSTYMCRSSSVRLCTYAHTWAQH